MGIRLTVSDQFPSQEEHRFLFNSIVIDLFAGCLGVATSLGERVGGTFPMVMPPPVVWGGVGLGWVWIGLAAMLVLIISEPALLLLYCYLKLLLLLLLLLLQRRGRGGGYHRGRTGSRGTDAYMPTILCVAPGIYEGHHVPVRSLQSFPAATFVLERFHSGLAPDSR